MISRKTIGSLLLALLIGVGLKLWTVDHPDLCSRFLAGDTSLPDSQVMESGDRLVAVPCTWWMPRQPVGVQGGCLAELAAAIVFVTSAAWDVRRNVVRRREAKR